MSNRENIEIFHQVNIDEYLKILKVEYGAKEHPLQPGSFLAGNPELPFYQPQQAEDHVFILSFNWVPLPFVLLKAFIDHPDLVPDEALVRWTEEQELVLESRIGQLRQQQHPKTK